MGFKELPHALLAQISTAIALPITREDLWIGVVVTDSLDIDNHELATAAVKRKV
jgi:hypothetical protein